MEPLDKITSSTFDKSNLPVLDELKVLQFCSTRSLSQITQEFYQSQCHFQVKNKIPPSSDEVKDEAEVNTRKVSILVFQL